MSLACIDSDRTAAVRRRYGGPAPIKYPRKSRGQRKWLDWEDHILVTDGPISTVKQLMDRLGRTDFSVRSRLKALQIRPLLERQR